MIFIERVAGAMRHHRLLRNAHWLWNRIRPLYNAAIRVLARNGIPRHINGTDLIRIAPELRGMKDTYEPEVWRHLMAEVRYADVFVDVGAFIGLYALAVGKRVGHDGRVIAFEPDKINYQVLRQNVRLNGLDRTVQTENKAVGSKCGEALFAGGKGLESRLSGLNATGSVIEVVTLDAYFDTGKADILKVDVEGFEQDVLEGAKHLLCDAARRPRAIFIEMHPFAWPISGATSAAILTLLHGCGYEVFTLDGSIVSEIREYGEVVARPVG